MLGGFGGVAGGSRVRRGQTFPRPRRPYPSHPWGRCPQTPRGSWGGGEAGVGCWGQVWGARRGEPCVGVGW
ncbi:hypothetical protein F3K43_35435 [Streptomyces sp. LBUM 1476]|nr:hypothetical protein [Streptomyces sp. LBUM 1476]